MHYLDTIHLPLRFLFKSGVLIGESGGERICYWFRLKAKLPLFPKTEKTVAFPAGFGRGGMCIHTICFWYVYETANMRSMKLPSSLHSKLSTPPIHLIPQRHPLTRSNLRPASHESIGMKSEARWFASHLKSKTYAAKKHIYQIKRGAALMQHIFCTKVQTGKYAKTRRIKWQIQNMEGRAFWVFGK